MSSIQNFLASISVGAATGWDIFILLIFLIAVFVYAYSLGRNRLVLLLICTYFSLSILRAVPWEGISSWSWLGIEDGPSSSTEILIFLTLILAFYFLIPRSILTSTFRIRKRGEASWPQLFILGIVQMGLLVMIILSFLPAETVAGLGPILKKLFIGGEAYFFWILLSIFTVVLMRRKKSPE